MAVHRFNQYNHELLLSDIEVYSLCYVQYFDLNLGIEKHHMNDLINAFTPQKFVNTYLIIIAAH